MANTDETDETDEVAPKVVLRPAEESDVEAVAVIWQQGWPDGHLGNVPEALVVRRRHLDDFLPLVQDRVGRTTVAVVDSKVVGFVVIHDDEIEHIYADRAVRGTGVASALLEHAEAAIGAHHDRAWLAVADGNARARRFYERHGWHDGGPFDNPAPTADGGTVSVPTRRYEKPT
jgi:ribosomal protein S18 acetylase RimI-like enzyme